MADKKTERVKALEAHTAFGKSYEIGDEYDCDVELVDSVVSQGKAARIEAGTLDRKDLKAKK